MVYMLTVSNSCYRSTVNDTNFDLTDLSADVRSFVEEYRKGHLDVKRLVSREGLDTRAHISTAIQGTDEAVKKVGQDLGKLALNVDVQVDQDKRKSLLQSLKYPGFNERRNQVDKAHTDTFNWVFAGDEGESDAPDSEMSTAKWDSFSNWLKSTDIFYWISGKPGSGKSTMVKYILTDQRTHNYLDIWSPHCLLISHYFWRPGNSMQRSINGFFCSLLYQLLENSETAIERVLESTEGSSMKSEVTDWPLDELQSTVLSTMEGYGRPVCIFLDGLDEVDPDQSTTLLDMIKEISLAGKTKMCLASRPEPMLLRHLYNLPHLRLQDLTAPDLTQYVYDNILESDFDDFETYENFVTSLAWRAEGVFLWLILVTRSIRKGFDNGDTIDIINERVDHLQGGNLDELYKDMWDRASRGNPDTYRRTAALYFRILLFYNDPDDSRMSLYGNSLSVFTMMLASTGFAEKILNAGPQLLDLVPEGTLLQGCKDVERIAEIYCFGLIEVFQPEDYNIITRMVGWYGGNYDKLLLYAQGRRTLRFIHRTAMDFLVDTVEGKEILSFDDTADSSHAFELVRANLAHAQLFCDFTEPIKANSLLVFHLDCIDAMRRYYIDADKSVSADCTRTMMYLQRLCDLEKVFVRTDITEAFICSGVDFFKAVAMSNWRCLDTISEDQIKALDKKTLSEILHILCKRLHPFQTTLGITDLFEMDFLRLINLLLSEGADPNWKGIPIFAYKRGRVYDISLTLRETPFVAFLSQILKHALKNKDDFRWYNRQMEELSGNDITQILLTLQTFISCEADLDEKVTIIMNPDFQRFCHHLRHTPIFTEGMRFIDAQASINGYMFICSLPAHDILNLVLPEWDYLQLVSNEGGLLADVKSSVASSTCRCIRRNDSVLHRFKATGSCPRQFPDGGCRNEWRWYEAPQHQDQIVKELMSLSPLLETTFDILQEQSSAAAQASGYETSTSMLCEPHWVETGSGSLENVLDRLVELGVFAVCSDPPEVHSIQDWLRLKGVLHATPLSHTPVGYAPRPLRDRRYLSFVDERSDFDIQQAAYVWRKVG